MSMDHPNEFLRSLGVSVQSDGCRRWSLEAKAYLVAETLKGDMTVGAVSRKFGVRRNLLSKWRCLARNGKLALPASAGDVPVEFAPLVVCGATPDTPPLPHCAEKEDKVEILFGGVSVRLGGDTAAVRIAEIARAVGGME